MPAKKHFEIPLNARWMTHDPASIGLNYRTLKNMRYKSWGLEGVAGHYYENGMEVADTVKYPVLFTRTYPDSETFVFAWGALGFTIYEITSWTGEITSDTLYTTEAGVDLTGRALMWHKAPGNVMVFDDAVPLGGLHAPLVFGGKNNEVKAVILSSADVGDDLVITNEKDVTDIAKSPLVTTETFEVTDCILIGFDRPYIDAINAYVSSGNTTTATISLEAWTSGGWDTVTLTADGTAASGKTLNKTGRNTITIDEAIVPLQCMIGGYYLYWYKILANTTISATLYGFTINAPPQPIKNIWSGEYVPPAAVFNNGGVRYDITTKVLKADYVTGETETYASLVLNAVSGHGIEIYSPVQLTGAWLGIVGTGNILAANVAVSYWDGSALQAISLVIDQTLDATVPFANSGHILWHNPDYKLEIKKGNIPTGFGSAAPEYYNQPMYMYLISVDSGVAFNLDHLTLIPIPEDLPTAATAFSSQNRLFIGGLDDRQANVLLVSAANTYNVFNGEDSYELHIGDADEEVIGGCELFGAYSGNIYSITLCFKRNETWAIYGRDAKNWATSIFKLSGSVGLQAKATLKIVNIPAGPRTGQKRLAAIWLGSDGLYMSDGRNPVKISEDLDELFKNVASSTSSGENVSAYIDVANNCYHLLVPLGDDYSLWATRREIVFDYSVNACFEINRGVDQDISYALDIEPYGTTYYLPLAFQNASEGPTPYYFLNTGNYFGASPIKYEVATGDFAPLGLQYETQLDKIKTVTSKHASMDLNIVHYVDTFDVTYTVTVELDAPSGSYLVATTSEGDISGDGESVDIEVEYDGSTTISVVPGADWWSLSLDGVEVYASSNDTKSYTLSNVTAAHTITISYYTPPM